MIDFSALTWEEIVLGVGGLLALATFIAKMTKTDKDDKAVSFVASIWQKIVGLKKP